MTFWSNQFHIFLHYLFSLSELKADTRVGELVVRFQVLLDLFHFLHTCIHHLHQLTSFVPEQLDLNPHTTLCSIVLNIGFTDQANRLLVILTKLDFFDVDLSLLELVYLKALLASDQHLMWFLLLIFAFFLIYHLNCELQVTLA